MNVSKTLASAAAAATLVGAIGIAYAQSTGTTGPDGGPATGSTPSQMQNQPTTPADSNTNMNSGSTPMTTPSDNSATTSNSDSGFQGERTAQADRN